MVKTGKLYAPEKAALSVTFVQEYCPAVLLKGLFATIFPEPALQASAETEADMMSASMIKYGFEMPISPPLEFSNPLVSFFS
jgi:hypothetical protein